MATTYLNLSNQILRELNEVTISAVASATGFQKFVTEAINKSIHDIYNSELEWPFAFSSGSQATTEGQASYTNPADTRTIDWDSFVLTPTDLVTNGSFTSNITSWSDVSTGTGTAAYTSTGNGRLRLSGGSSGVGWAEQSLSTVDNRTYKLTFRTFGGDIQLVVGTSTGASDILAATTFSVTDVGAGEFHTQTFTATGTTTFIGFKNSANANYDVDIVQCIENDVDTVKLEYIPYQEWRDNYQEDEQPTDPDSYGTPVRVYPLQNGKFGLSPIPDRSSYTIGFDYWATHTDLSSDSSTHSIPTRYEPVLIERVLYYAYRLRQDMSAASDSKSNYQDGIKRMRIELINKPEHMWAK